MCFVGFYVIPYTECWLNELPVGISEPWPVVILIGGWNTTLVNKTWNKCGEGFWEVTIFTLTGKHESKISSSFFRIRCFAAGSTLQPWEEGHKKLIRSSDVTEPVYSLGLDPLCLPISSCLRLQNSHFSKPGLLDFQILAPVSTLIGLQTFITRNYLIAFT